MTIGQPQTLYQKDPLSGKLKFSLIEFESKNVSEQLNAGQTALYMKGSVHILFFLALELLALKLRQYLISEGVRLTNDQKVFLYVILTRFFLLFIWKNGTDGKYTCSSQNVMQSWLVLEISMPSTSFLTSLN